MTTKNTTNSIEHTVNLMVEQLCSTLDSDLEGTPLNPSMAEGKEEFELPSQKDMFLRIFISQQIQNCHNQLLGYTTSAGNSITGLDHWLKMAKLNTEENPGFRHRWATRTPNANDLTYLKRLEDTEAKIKFVSDIKDAWEQAYMKVFREAWKPYNATVSSPATTNIDPSKLNEKFFGRFN